ncbi:hypothetical protein COU76_06100 [Candidatus Peregrinibacteria bacterium CG10_big_fil_rev_8_21_14_0_10_49_10]|nr:MAG: hypothetical protein COU76_06100 [Candidatus Peregrinibacteria bacterium CG10_big_fil_rev_8_21_14_0_10_49_10]
MLILFAVERGRAAVIARAGDGDALVVRVAFRMGFSAGCRTAGDAGGATYTFIADLTFIIILSIHNDTLVGLTLQMLILFTIKRGCAAVISWTGHTYTLVELTFGMRLSTDRRRAGCTIVLQLTLIGTRVINLDTLTALTF